jgi:4-hydroxybenzoate polyprenyltransferase
LKVPSKYTSLTAYRPTITSVLRHASTTTSPSTNPNPPPYNAPATGLLARLPPSWIPYAELIRLDKPTGTYYLFAPCLFSTLLAAPLTTPITPLPIALGYSALFFGGALIMRGAGCTINDLWDRNLDPHVERTRLRPIARRAVTPRQAIIFTGAQLLAGLGILVSFPHQCLYYGVPSLIFVTLYPLAKRVTYYPQFVLGLTFSWGAWMGFPALGISIFDFDTATWALSIADMQMFKSAALLYASCVTWTLVYDMIYAFQDIRDDAKVGIKSIALAHQTNTKAFLTSLAAVQVGLLAAAGAAVGAGPVFFAGSCGSAVVTLGTMIWKVNLKSPKDCWWWFRNGCLLTGGGISLGLFGEYLAQLTGLYDTKDDREEGVEN